MSERHGRADIVVGMVSAGQSVLSAVLAGKIDAGMREYFPQYSWMLVRATTSPADASAGLSLPWTTIPIDQFGVHHVTFPWHSVPAKTNGYRAIFEFAREKQATACLLVDPCETGFGKEWIDAMVRPGIHSRYDLVTPVYAGPVRRHAISGNLLAPMLRALLGGGPRQPMSSELLLSAKLMDRLLARHDWDSASARYTPELWITFIAAAERFRLAESATGPTARAPGCLAISRQEVIAQIVGGFFALLEQYENRWPIADSVEELDRFGTLEPVGDQEVRQDGLEYLQCFAAAFPSLREHWRFVLHPHTFGAVEEYAASLKNGETNRFMANAAWVRIVYEIAAAWKLQRFPRSQIVGLFTPLLLARIGSFLLRTRWMEHAEVEAELDRLAKYFEALKPVLTGLWKGMSAGHAGPNGKPNRGAAAA